MKKTLLAVAIAGVVAAPMVASADTTLYGSVRLSVTYDDNDADKTSNGGNGQDGNWDVVNQSSRLGFKGAEDLGNGLSAIYQYEFGVDAADTAAIGGSSLGGRLALVGLKSNWGQVALGRQWNPYYWAVGGEVDVFNAGFSSPGYYGNDGPTRDGSMVTYISPTFMGGLSLQGALEMDGANAEKGVDVWQIAAIYDNGPLFAGASWRQSGEKVDRTNPFADDNNNAPLEVTGEKLNQYGLSARYDLGNFRLAGSAQWVDDDKLTADNRFGYDLVGEYRFGNNLVRLAYFNVGDSDAEGTAATNPGFPALSAKDGYDGWIAGYQHRFSKRTRVYAEYGMNNEADERLPNGEKIVYKFEDKQFALGIRHDF